MNILQRFILFALGRRKDDYVTTVELEQRLNAMATWQPSEEDRASYARWRTTNPILPTNGDPHPWRKTAAQPKFVFADNEAGRKAFFELQCKYGDTKIELNKGVVALVLDGRSEFNWQTPVQSPAWGRDDGSQAVALKVISEGGGFVVMAHTAGVGPELHPGDFVLWVPIDKFRNPFSEEARTDWVGTVRAKVKAQGPPWEIICKYG